MREAFPEVGRQGIYALVERVFDSGEPYAAPAQRIELDLGSVVPSIAGPKRPQDRIALTDAKAGFRRSLADYATDDGIHNGVDESVAESFPASDSPAAGSSWSPGRSWCCRPPPGSRTCWAAR